MRAVEMRPVEQRVHVFRCDRCGREIPSVRNSGGGSDLTEGTNLSARGGKDWTWLIDSRVLDYGTHGPEFHAANVDICGQCLISLREWFAEEKSRSGEGNLSSVARG